MKAVLRLTAFSAHPVVLASQLRGNGRMTAAGSTFSGAWPYALTGLLALVGRAFVPRDGRRLQRFLRELLLLIPFVLSYFVARGLAAERPAIALANGQSLLRLEQALGIFH